MVEKPRRDSKEESSLYSVTHGTHVSWDCCCGQENAASIHTVSERDLSAPSVPRDRGHLNGRTWDCWQWGTLALSPSSIFMLFSCLDQRGDHSLRYGRWKAACILSWAPFSLVNIILPSCFLLALSITSSTLFCCHWHFESLLTAPLVVDAFLGSFRFYAYVSLF